MKFKFIRYFKYQTKPTKDDIIVVYFYEERAKKWIFEKSWSYANMQKYAETHENGVLEVIDMLFDMLPTSFNTMTGKPEIEIFSLPLEQYSKGSDLDD